MNEKQQKQTEFDNIVDGKWAIVWSPDDGISLITPNMKDDGHREVPDMGLALTACMLRLNGDTEFRDECIEWFKNRAKHG